MNLSRSEEQLMGFLWTLKKAFLKELMECYPKPKPAITTISTLLKRIQDKGFITYTVFRNSRQYTPVITKKDYFANHLDGLIKNHFEDSALQFASFFTTSTKLTKSELEELRKLVDGEIKSQNK